MHQREQPPNNQKVFFVSKVIINNMISIHKLMTRNGKSSINISEYIRFEKVCFEIWRNKRYPSIDVSST